ncbi:MAG: hypothetical protein AAF467_27700 [Actinomycetota bacterium]
MTTLRDVAVGAALALTLFTVGAPLVILSVITGHHGATWLVLGFSLALVIVYDPNPERHRRDNHPSRRRPNPTS